MKIWFTMQLEGFHSWPGAPARSSYLAHNHRHMFHIKVWCDVTHADRDVEFIEAKGKVQERLMKTTFPQLHNLSCEHLCGIVKVTCESFNLKVVRVSVSEDGENGAEEDYL